MPNFPLSRNPLRAAVFVLAAIGPALFPLRAAAQGQILPPAPPAARVQISEGPTVESAKDGLAIIRWTSNNPGGSDEHFGIVHYGTDPDHLTQTAKSHIRLNQNHPTTVFRVRIEGLHPATTYYYTVDSQRANGTSDGVKSPTSHFTTP